MTIAACSSPAPTPATPTAPPTASPSPSPSPEPSAPPATQADVLGAVGRWLATHEGSRPTDFTYVDLGLNRNTSWYDRNSVDELRGAGAAVFGDELTEASQAALSEAFASVELEFVADPQSVVDPNGFEHFGCRPYLETRTMLHLGAPLPRNDDPTRFYVAVNFDRGCGGDIYLLEVGPDGAGYGVVRVVRGGGWIV